MTIRTNKKKYKCQNKECGKIVTEVEKWIGGKKVCKRCWKKLKFKKTSSGRWANSLTNWSLSK